MKRRLNLFLASIFGKRIETQDGNYRVTFRLWRGKFYVVGERFVE